MDYTNFGSGVGAERIAKWRQSGKKALGVICCHVPFELLHAAGILPVRLRAAGCWDFSRGEALLGEQNCGFCKAILHRLDDGTYDLDGLVASNGCTVASMVYTNWRTICEREGKDQFLYIIDPPRMSTDSAARFFAMDMEDLMIAIEELTGVKITNEMLRASTELYNEARRLVKQIYDLHKAENPVVTGEETLRLTLAASEMPVEEYIELLRGFLAEAELRKPEKSWPVRVMVAGSALDDPEYVRAIEDAGCLVVADMNSFGLRFLRDEIEFDPENVLASLSAYYMNRSSCPRMIDGTDQLHDYLLTAVRDYAVDGVILERLSFCDKWQSESAIMANILEEAGIPCLQLEREEQMTARGQLAIRLEAFREMLEKD